MELLEFDRKERGCDKEVNGGGKGRGMKKESCTFIDYTFYIMETEIKVSVCTESC